MSQEPVLDNTLKNFVDLFLRAEGSGAKPDSEIWGQVEELARRAIRQVELLKRPTDVNPSDWAKARECMDYAAHSVVEKDKKNIDVTHVLGFLPIMMNVLDGNIEKMTGSWKLGNLSAALAYKFEYSLRVHPCWITHDTLQSADARDIQLLLQALINGKKPDSMWHQPQAVACEDICVRVFYLPVVYSVHGTMEPDWNPLEVYEPCDFSAEGEDAILEALNDAFDFHGEQETRVLTGDVGLAEEVLNESMTRRDLNEIDSRMQMIRNAVMSRENTAHEARIEIQLTWGTPVGGDVEPSEAPAIRFSIMARNQEDEGVHRMVQGVHVDPQDPESWGKSVQHLLGICFRVGWPDVQIKQVSGTQALNFWSELHAPTQLM